MRRYVILLRVVCETTRHVADPSADSQLYKWPGAMYRGGASFDTPDYIQSASSQSTLILCVVIFWYICRENAAEQWGCRILQSAIFNAGVHYGSTETVMEQK